MVNGRFFSLRLRLFLAFVAVAMVMAGLGLLALRQSRQIHRQVTDLTSISIARFEHDRTVGQALEIEVDPGSDPGTWIADEVEVLGGRRRPKLRGPVDAVDQAASSLRMFGVSILVPPQVAASDLPEGRLGGIQPGDRLEISCTLDADGNWSARKIRTGDIKSSNKIKGMVTGVSMDGISPDSVAISGITILFDQTSRAPNPDVELKRISLATRMVLLAQDCTLAARRVSDGSDEAFVTLDGELTDASTLLAESASDLADAVRRARGETGSQAGLDDALWLDPLEQEAADLDELATRFLDLAVTDPDQADQLLRQQLEPLLVNRLRPLIQSYLLDGEESLALEVEAVSTRAQATARALMGASAVALLASLALGWAVWRTLNAPLLRLTEAARQIGQGRLDTRIQDSSPDELGVLARTLNRMAEELQATTVSIANLDGIFESIAGALFVLDGSGRVTSANEAACALTGHAAQDLRGQVLADICVPAPGEALLPDGSDPSRGDGLLNRQDGSQIPVSFSGAVLRRNEDAAEGFVWIAQDLTNRLAMEEQLRRSLAEKELLLREVHHRVKNNLQVISSLLEMQADCIDDDQARAVYAVSQARIRSMALIHQQLYGASTLDRIDFGAYLEQLAVSLYQFHEGGPGGVTIEAAADPVQLSIDQALTCGLIVNELVTNALKHAFSPERPGTVKVEFRQRNGRHELTVTDDGVGLSGTPDPDSLGMSLVTALAEQLGGRLDIRSDGGTTFFIAFPSEEQAA